MYSKIKYIWPKVVDFYCTVNNSTHGKFPHQYLNNNSLKIHVFNHLSELFWKFESISKIMLDRKAMWPFVSLRNFVCYCFEFRVKALNPQNFAFIYSNVKKSKKPNFLDFLLILMVKCTETVLTRRINCLCNL